MSLFAKLQQSFVAGLIRAAFKIEIINPENEPDYSGYIVCANHSSNYDPIVLGTCMHKPVRYMAKSSLFKIPLLNQLIKTLGAYPVNRKKADVTSIKTTISILQNGEIVGMYPSGKRSKKRHPETAELKNGVAMVASRAKAGVLPVSIIAKGYKVRLFRKTRVVIGNFIPYEELNFVESSMEDYRRATVYIYDKILKNYRTYDYNEEK